MNKEFLKEQIQMVDKPLEWLEYMFNLSKCKLM